ncbi:hypothetical protein MIND_00638700 [Mycena indigotica]|uniref:DUF1793-domain-containing protein n=1 Tax=Mycena indigotica TaxID=2126181 RepID=A0A8H6SSH0_9AGAR|nr:uncharacterized protein MIND_00638700 [Mycena indigotica]KAF7304072.1 hypothetical protein MIND_00638700 [Mycena indigotica]
MLPLGLLLLSEAFLAAAVVPQTFFPPAVPLAVRSPALNTWLDTRGGGNPMTTWPNFWNDQHIDGWAGYIRVNGVAYHWLGSPVPGKAATWVSTSITPTRTILNIIAGPMDLNVTFLSPIEPADLARQSFPFSYVYVDGVSTDGQIYNVQLYADISAEWVTNGMGTAINWQTQQTSNAVYLQVQSTSPSSIFQDVPEDSTAFHAIASNQPGRQTVIGTDVHVRPILATNDTAITLTSDLTDTSSGLVNNGGKFPILAHMVDLGNVSTIPTVAWAVGVLRDPVVTYDKVARHGYWWSKYATIGDAINAFIIDFPSAKSRAIALDQKILSDAGAVSTEYGDIISLGLRQALAGIEITVSNNLNGMGGFNTSDVLAFMKDVGNTQRVNPTETIYALMPALVYLNSSLIGLLIEPLLRFQSSHLVGYAAPDLGSSYPTAPGNTANTMGVGLEHSGNMIILALAHARGSGDGSILARYYTLFQSYAAFLTNHTFGPEQQSADSTEPILHQTNGNNTNLGVKAIVGLRAMAQISAAIGDTASQKSYTDTAQRLTQTWTSRAMYSAGSTTGLAWEYNQGATSGLMYNLFADRLLGLGAFPDSVYQVQVSQLSNTGPFGVPLSSDSNSITRSDWTLFTAAAISSVSSPTRNTLISGVRARASHNETNGTFANIYNYQTGAGVAQGAYPNGFATPAQGAMLSVLSLRLYPTKLSLFRQELLPFTATPVPSKANVGAIAGGVIGGIFILTVFGIALFFFLRRQRRRREDEGGWNDNAERNTTVPRPWRPPPSLPSLDATGGRTTQGSTNMSGRSPESTVPVSIGLQSSIPPQGRSFVPGQTTPLPFAMSHEKSAQILERDRLLNEEPASDSQYAHSRSQPSISGSGSGVTTSGSGTEELRSELANLRREMAQLRAQTDAPPMYQ